MTGESAESCTAPRNGRIRYSTVFLYNSFVRGLIAAQYSSSQTVSHWPKVIFSGAVYVPESTAAVASVNFFRTSFWVWPYTLFRMIFPVAGSRPAENRASQSPSARCRIDPAPFALFAMAAPSFLLYFPLVCVYQFVYLLKGCYNSFYRAVIRYCHLFCISAIGLIPVPVLQLPIYRNS